jgi:putative N6-adenine-specific DNA methylase
MFEYQQHNSFFAQVTGQMEELCEKELIELGAINTKKTYRGIFFNASTQALYKINYTSRLLSRVLAPLFSFSCHNTEAIKKIAKKISWEKILSADKTFAITASISNSNINNSLYAALCLKDGIADYFRENLGKRPNVDKINPDVRLNLHIEKDSALISLDTSGEALHKRGYRLLAGKAPMQETLAAALIRISNWNGSNVLWDPMCGSGTILCEAAMLYSQIPAQFLRVKFGFFNMPDFRLTDWNNIKNECDKKIRQLPRGIITGSDVSSEAIKVAKSNLSRLPYGDCVELKCTSFQKVNKFENGTLITNPPYGMRLGKINEVQNLYKELGDFLKTKCTGTSAFIFTCEPSLRKSVGLKTSRRIHLSNGKLEGVLLQIVSYKGSKKNFTKGNDDEK